MRVVLDTNVLIAAFATQGLCRLILEFCLTEHEVVLNEEILAELNEKLHRKLKVPSKDIEKTLSFLRKNVHLESAIPLQKNVCRDPEDLPVLGTTLSAKGDFLVTGDQDMLILKNIQGIPIVTPREFWEKHRKRE